MTKTYILPPPFTVSHPVRHALEQIRLRLHGAARRAKRDAAEITLVGASKTVSAARLREFQAAGLRVAGENYVQEGLAKRDELQELDLSWHLIGGLQSKKARVSIAFDLIHSVDRLSVITALDRAAGEAGTVQDVLLQVNLAGEAGKGGCSPDAVRELAESVGRLRHLQLCGLMCLPPFAPDPEASRPYFRQLRGLRDRVQQEFPTCRMLSMGMSHDFEVAVEEGATLVRVGTALFGTRQ